MALESGGLPLDARRGMARGSGRLSRHDALAPGGFGLLQDLRVPEDVKRGPEEEERVLGDAPASSTWPAQAGRAGSVQGVDTRRLGSPRFSLPV